MSWPTVKRWATRYAEMGKACTDDCSSRLQRSSNRTFPKRVRRIVNLQRRHRLSSLAVASRLSMPAPTVHAVLVRCCLNRLSHIDNRTAESIQHYEQENPWTLIDVDIKKLGNIPTSSG